MKTSLLYQSIQKFIKSELRVRITSFPIESSNSTKALYAGIIMEWLWKNKEPDTAQVIVYMKSHLLDGNPSPTSFYKANAQFHQKTVTL